MAGAALRCRGLVENDAEILQAAADAYARGSRPLGLALACENAGAAFAGRAGKWTVPARRSVKQSSIYSSGSTPGA